VKQIREIELPKATDLALSLKNDTEDAQKTKEFCEQFKVKNNDDLDLAVKALAEIKTQYSTYEQRRKDQVQKILDVVQDINSFFQPALDALVMAESIIKGKVSDCVTNRLDARDTALAQVEKAIPSDRALLIKDADKLLPPKISGLSFRENWKVEVVDDLAAVEHLIETKMWSCLTVEKKSITAMVKSMKADPEIPGIVAKKTRSVVISPKRVH
jgi:hypothetical protein